ncbi:uncharacterized protein [Apostichopus japonicus]|uniref:uncharacterized protein n=1 Tax=Stichopus japonicus TaxID=307972 RepID=UPI003AB3CF65
MEAVSSIPGNIRLMTFLSVSGWTVMSISLSNINKWIFQNHPFNYPIFLTSLHLLSTLIFCSTFFKLTAMGRSIKENFDQNPISGQVSWNILLLSFIFSISIACGNIAVQFLYISFLKMIFAMTPLATLILSRVFLKQSSELVTYLSLIPICVGCVMCTVGEINFNLIGFLMALVATLLRAVRSVLQGFLLKEERIDSFSLLYRMSVPSFIQLLAAAVIFERPVFSDSYLLSTPSLWMLIGLSCSCAVGYNIMAFLVTFYTSPITLQVLGNLSMVLTVGLSLLLFRNELSLISILGIVSVTIGSWIYQKSDKVTQLLIYFQILPKRDQHVANHHK